MALTLLVLTLILHLWKFDFITPFSYGGDATLHLMFTKAFVENGWYLRNPMLGAPTVMEMYEFPAADTLPGLFIKLLGVFSHDPAIINNVFFLLTFPLASLCAFFACRQIGISVGPAMLSSLLYAFLPYHFFRSSAHLYLSAYFVAPLAVLVAWWIATGRLFPDCSGWRSRRFLVAAALCATVSMAGVYYPLFAAVILFAASLLALFSRRDYRHFLAGGVCTALVIGGTVVCLAPFLWHLRGHTGPLVSRRSPGESELYGLKIAQVVLPMDGHRLPAFSAYKQRYNIDAPLVNENSSASVGAIGAFGFLWLLGWLLFRPVLRFSGPAAGSNASGQRTPALSLSAGPDGNPGEPADRSWQILDTFSVLNGAAVLFGTVGGMGSIFAMLFTPQARCINRISVFVAFFALVAVAACLDVLARRSRYAVGVRAIGWGVLGVLLWIGVLDQSPHFHVSAFKTLRREYREDGIFFRKVESVMPKGAMIFQLPYVSFPEGGVVQHMEDYSHFRGYLHTHDLRWSYGAIKNGPGDMWQQHVTALPPDEFIRQIAMSGFGGVYLDRDGYADGGLAMEGSLRQILGPPSAYRQRRLFFSMENYNASLRAAMTPEQWEQGHRLALTFPGARFLAGFAGQESSPEHTWRWAAQDSEIELVNPALETRRVRVRMVANTGTPGPAQLVMSTGSERQVWAVNGMPQVLTATLDLPPGTETVHFSCSAKPIYAPADARVLVWSVTDFQLEENAISARIQPPVVAPAK